MAREGPRRPTCLPATWVSTCSTGCGLAEPDCALAYPQRRQRIEAGEAQELIALLRREAPMTEGTARTRSPDPGDDCLIALGAVAQAAIVSGDVHPLGLADDLPVYSPSEIQALLEAVP